MSKGRDKPSVIDCWNIEHSPRKCRGSKKYSTALVYFNTVIGVIVNTALCYCILNVGYSTTFKGVFSYTVLHSRNALWVIQCCTVKPTLTRTELLHFLDLVYGIGNIVFNWLLGNIDMHFVICTNFSQRSSIILGFLILHAMCTWFMNLIDIVVKLSFGILYFQI
jgi:hypothetical protein